MTASFWSPFLQKEKTLQMLYIRCNSLGRVQQSEGSFLMLLWLKLHYTVSVRFLDGSGVRKQKLSFYWGSAIKGLRAFSGGDCFGKTVQVSDKQLPCLQGVQSWTDKPSSWRDYAIFKIREHVANGLEMIRDLCPLDGGIRAASAHLHSQRMLISYRFPRTNVCEMDWVSWWWLWESWCDCGCPH